MLDDFLSYLGATLDKPGRAVRGVLGGRPEELAAAIPFSDSLGLSNVENRVSGEDLLRKYVGSTGNETADSILGFGTELATDPTTYLGGFLGRLGGRALGRGLETAAQVRGPGYKTLGEALKESALAKGGRDAAYKVEDFMAHPSFNRAVSEIPEGSQYLGHGAEAVAFQTPGGDVARMSLSKVGGETRPIDIGVLPTNRTADYAGPTMNGIRVERSPFAQSIPNGPSNMPTFGTTPRVLSPELAQQVKYLPEELATRGLDFFDSHLGNVGLYNGRPVVIDPGAVTHLGAAPGPMAPSVTAGDPGAMYRYLLDALGGQPAMQRALAAGRSVPGYERGLGYAGMGAGASVGGF